jgi:hypothetical protein
MKRIKDQESIMKIFETNFDEKRNERW